MLGVLNFGSTQEIWAFALLYLFKLRQGCSAMEEIRIFSARKAPSPKSQVEVKYALIPTLGSLNPKLTDTLNPKP